MVKNSIPTPTDASIILTYRCPMRCQMCNIWQNPTDKKEEIVAADLRSLPKLKFINLTGGEPFIREDLAEIVEECYKHTKRIVISTSGWFEDRIIALAKQFPNIGIRISIEGLSQKNDELRGREGGFDKGLRTLLTLQHMGQPTEAINKLNLIVAAYPQSADALATRASVLYGMKRYALARADYDRLVSMQPREAEWLVERARCLVALGEKTAARRDLDKAVQLGTPQGVVQALYNLTR